MKRIMVNPNGGFLKITVAGVVNIDEFLRVSVGQGKPGALDLYHQAMTFFKGMRNIG